MGVILNKKLSERFCYSNLETFWRCSSSIFDDYLVDDVVISVYDYHGKSFGSELPKPSVENLEKFFDSNSSLGFDKTKTNFIIINWGANAESNKSGNNDSFLYIGNLCGGRLCSDSVLIPATSNEFKESLLIMPKSKDPIGAFYKSKTFENLYFFWVGYDSLHYGDADEVKAYCEMIRCLAIQNAQYPIFKKVNVIERHTTSDIQTKEFKSISKKYDEFVKSESIKEEDLIEEMLGKVDIPTITSVLNASLKVDYINQGDGIIVLTPKCVKNYLINWAKQKKEVYLLFGRNLKITNHVQCKKDELVTGMEIDELKSKYPQYILNLSLFSNEEYTNNKMQKSPHSDFSNYANRLLSQSFPRKEGMKVSKYLSQLIKDKNFDIDFSKVLQDKFIDLDLSISIDPYDYLTSAVNRSGWRSCHNFMNGEKKNATLSYLFDNSTMVAYASNGKDYEYNFEGVKFKGNSKNWRQLIFLDLEDNRFITAREYPQDYGNEVFTTNVRQTLESIISNFCDIDDNWVIRKNSAVKDNCYQYLNKIAYDDIPSRNTITVYHKFHKDVTHKTIIGSEPKCIVCQNKKISSEITCGYHKSGIKNVESLVFRTSIEDIARTIKPSKFTVEDLIESISQSRTEQININNNTTTEWAPNTRVYTNIINELF